MRRNTETPRWAIDGMFWPQRKELNALAWGIPGDAEALHEKILSATTADAMLAAILENVIDRRIFYAKKALNDKSPKEQQQLYGYAVALSELAEDIREDIEARQNAEPQQGAPQ
jgi:hypothetical protein